MSDTKSMQRQNLHRSQVMPSFREALLLGLRNRAIPVFAVRPDAADDLALFAARKKLLVALLNRISELHINSPPLERFFIDQPYVEDKRKVACIITANFVFPGCIFPFGFWLYGAHIMGLQHGNILHIQVHRQISQQLWDDIRLKIIPPKEKFIIGYLALYMPRINRHLLDNRYHKEHLLSRTFATFEAIHVSLAAGGRRMPLNWPLSFAPFPPSENIAPNVRAPYVYDFIDFGRFILHIRF